jgi:hypothetical protein
VSAREICYTGAAGHCFPSIIILKELGLKKNTNIAHLGHQFSFNSDEGCIKKYIFVE